jgi:hypothetical protein
VTLFYEVQKDEQIPTLGGITLCINLGASSPREIASSETPRDNSKYPSETPNDYSKYPSETPRNNSKYPSKTPAW